MARALLALSQTPTASPIPAEDAMEHLQFWLGRLEMEEADEE